jgi:hypothetical protein
MADFFLSPNRANYQRFREVMDDGDKFPETFDQWEKKAKGQVADAKKGGFVLKPVSFDPDKFVAFCREQGLPCGSQARAMYAITVGLAKNMN